MSQYLPLTHRSDKYANWVISVHANLIEAEEILDSQGAGIYRLEQITKLLLETKKLIVHKIGNPKALSDRVNSLLEETRQQISRCRLDT